MASHHTRIALVVHVMIFLVAAGPRDAAGQPQTKEIDPLIAIQQDIIALRSEFKQWVQKAEQDQETAQEHIGEKLAEVVEISREGLSPYSERVEQLQELQASLESYDAGIAGFEAVLTELESRLMTHLDQIETTLADVKARGIPRQRVAAEPGGLPVPSAADGSPDASSGNGPMMQIPPGQLFRAAYKFYMEGDYDTAIAGFQKYLFDYPDTQLAGAAQFWIAESLSKVEEYEIALQEYERLLTQYPDNDKLPDGYYGKAAVLLKLNRTDEARQMLQYVTDHYQGTIAARKAESRLRELQ